MINYLASQKNWQSQLSDTINRLDELLTVLELPELLETSYNPRQNNFPLRVPRAFVAKMQKGNPNDPLLLQVLPDKRALQPITGYVADPLAENEHNPQQGLIHKYQSRVLITVTGACAIHCRYCFRQHFDYKVNTPNSKQKQQVLAYIKTQPNVNEVILSGGDPLSLNNERLFSWLNDLAELEQIQTIRIHTRFPVVIPERLDDELLDFFNKMNAEKVRLIMVIHCNHANEIDDNTARHLT
ncbi:MAG: KamA family radical SAM protein, partial [Moraxellaceae bacterium]|nr:KamA family radical SAM protein [Moraxellaceae bacterium]